MEHPSQWPQAEHIRCGDEQDLEAILAIEAACFAQPWPAELLGRRLEQGSFFVYEEAQAIRGYIIIGLRPPRPWEQLRRQLQSWLGRASGQAEPYGHVLNLAVAPRYRRRGIAGVLLRTGLAYLRHRRAGCVELEVRVNNEAALQLYRKFGFQIVARLPRYYYQQAEDAYLMRKCFQSSPCLDR